MTSYSSSVRISGTYIVTLAELEEDFVKIELGYSPTAKNKLIEALSTNRALEAIEIDQFTPLDLVVYIFALLKTSGIADKKTQIIAAFLDLSRKFITMAHFSKANWQSLVRLLQQNPNNDELIAFLKSEHADEPDAMDFTFFCATWTQLADIFNSPHALSSLQLEETFLQEVAAKWLETSAHPDIIVDCLLFTYYLCGGPRFENWDQNMLISQPPYQEYILRVIHTAQDGKFRFSLLEECTTLFQEPGWAWAKVLSDGAAKSLLQLFKTYVNPDIDPRFCVHILDNSLVPLATKVELVLVVLEALPIVNVQLLHDFFLSLQHSAVGASVEDREAIAQVYMKILNMEWESQLIVCTLETNGLLQEYCKFSGVWIYRFIELTTELYEDGARFVDAFMIKYVMAFVENLMFLAVQSTNKKSPRIPMVKSALITIKEMAIRTLFRIYGILEDPEVRKCIYKYLALKLPQITITGTDEEFMVAEYPSNDGKYHMLGFGLGGVETQYVITDCLIDDQ